MLRTTMRRNVLAVTAVYLLSLLLAAGVPALAQDVIERDAGLADRPISEIVAPGADPEDLQLILNNVRAAVGDPFNVETVREDMARIARLGRFRLLSAEAELREDGTVRVIYNVMPQLLVREVQTIGNRALSDQELRRLIPLAPGLARDEYLIEKARRDIKERYREKGYYLTEVSIDESELAERGLLIFRIIEGPRVRIKAIEFEGNDAFSDDRLLGQVRTRTHIFLLRRGVVDEEQLEADVGRLDRFYKDRGYLDVRIDHAVELSPDNREAKITFYIAEGAQYRLRSVQVENRDDPQQPLRVFTPEHLLAMMDIQPGDDYSDDKLRKSIDTIRRAYGVLGYADLYIDWDRRIDTIELRSGPAPIVDLLLIISEGRRYKVGNITIDDNSLTQERVVRREVTLEPGRPFDATQLDETERRLRATRLFGNVRLTLQDEDPHFPGYRDVLVQVKEKNTGSVNFGVAAGSDAGLFGEISLIQDNFDIADWPESAGELLTGRAFRGAGQRFAMTFRPGNEIFQYSMSLTEPHLFDSVYSTSIGAAYRSRFFSNYDEQRITGTLSFGRRFGDVWEAGVRLRGERIELNDIDADAPTEVFLDTGPDTISAVGLSLTRTTIGTITRPRRGSRLEMSLDRIGLIGGDFDFFNAQADYTVFVTLQEDFLGRASILKLNTKMGYIFGEDGRVPTYERFYLGGRSFRGFEFRTVSPKGIRADTGEKGDDPIGGQWMFFLGAQYEVPVFRENLTGVFFVDTGTVTDDFGFDDYRVSVGVGVRLYIPQLGPVPIAFDLGFPLLEGEGDEQRLFSFSAEFPF